ncbi:MAG: tetratricopeptide repeat protein [Lachnospiraceae bacterium]
MKVPVTVCKGHFLLPVSIRVPGQKVAAIYTNLALAEIKLLRYEEAMDHLKRAISLYEMDEERDYHYSGALSAMGEVLYMTGSLRNPPGFISWHFLKLRGHQEETRHTKLHYKTCMQLSRSRKMH